ncbi:MAG: family transporter [Chloroflexi bacterium]|jgi:RND superfamily putative drug exporter|nr:family transporter [Chloroflexota bacterium]
MLFYNLGKWIFHHKWLVIAAWLVAVAVSIPFVPRVLEPLKTGGFSDPSLESSQAATLLQNKLGYSTSNLVIFYQSKDPQLKAQDPRFIQEIQTSLADLTKSPAPYQVVLPSVNPRQVSADNRTAYVVVTFALDGETATKLLPQIRPLIKQPPSLTMTIGGGLAFYEDVELVSQRDLQRAELIAFPVAIVALVLAFGSVVAGGLPVAVGGVGVLVILASIFGLAHLTDISIFAVNLATLLGLGLGLDYSLFLTSRFREELARGRTNEEALAITLATAGKAVAFSGLTVLIGLSGTLLFRINILTSVGIAGFVVVIVSVLAAITLLPAILTLVGARINALPVSGLFRRKQANTSYIPGRQEGHGFWAWLAHLVMKRPVSIFVPVLALLLILGLPFLNVKFSSPDASILPTDVPSRQAFDILRSQFNESEVTPILVAVQAPANKNILSPDNIYYLYDFAQAVQKDPRVARVDSIVTFEERLTRTQYQLFYSDPSKVQDIILRQFLQSYANENVTLISIVSKYPPTSDETKALVQKLRNSTIGNDLTLQVTGGTAGIMDVVDGIYKTFPLAALVIVLATYFVLLILLRSIILPLKAIMMNALSILASYGALVYVFQEGNFSNLLNFQPLGLIEPSLPIIMFCTLFGLSMDYEVFLLSRIKENYEHTGDNTASVAMGLQKSGKIITSAALIVVLVCLSFVTADIVLVKALGLGVAVAVGLDATIVRALLVPSTMRLLGNWNWYAPAWLLRILPQAQLETENFTPATKPDVALAEPGYKGGKTRV